MSTSRFFEYADWDQKLDDIHAIIKQLRNIRSASRFLPPEASRLFAEQLLASMETMLGTLDALIQREESKG